jgi:hypothetical protein
MLGYPMRCQIARFVIPFLFLFACGSAPAQQGISAKAGTIRWAEGELFLDDKPVKLPPDGYLQMENGGILNTKKGFAGLVLTPTAYLWLGENASLLMEENALSDVRLELKKGSAFIEVIDIVEEVIKITPIAVRLLLGAVNIRQAGLYRFDSGASELRVYGGVAFIKKRDQEIEIKKGYMMRLGGNFAPSIFYPYESDALHRWAGERSFKLFADFRISRWVISKGWATSSEYRMRFPANVTILAPN